VRAFLAVPVLPPALQEGERLLDRLRVALPEVRWVRSEGLHLTLHFFANLAEDEVARVVAAARDATQLAQPYGAQLGGLGCFPRDGDERVLWIGMRSGAAETATLQCACEDNLDRAGFVRESRPYRPHVTLGRPRTRFSDDVRRRWQRYADSELPPFEATELRLYRSHLGTGGSRYEVLATLPL